LISREIPQPSFDKRGFDKIAAENALLIVPPLEGCVVACRRRNTPWQVLSRCYFEETSTFSG